MSAQRPPDSPQQAAQRIVEQMTNVASNTAALTLRYEGFMKLHSAACQENNQAEMEAQRQNVLSVVGQILDNAAIQHMLSRQIGDLGRL